MTLWIKDPDSGRLDVIETLALYTLVIVLAKFMVSEMSFGPIVFGAIDGGTIAALLTPTLGALTFKKHSENLTKGPNA
jgi:uncharacterized YccA/Bax inhibitor family protein